MSAPDPNHPRDYLNVKTLESSSAPEINPARDAVALKGIFIVVGLFLIVYGFIAFGDRSPPKPSHSPTTYRYGNETITAAQYERSIRALQERGMSRREAEEAYRPFLTK